jgi:curli biogenesis system outer membrane secretion channel CsgG
MKRTVILLLLISMLPVNTTSAQNTNLEKLNNYKIGFFTKRLNFTSEEAQKFWPVYNEYQNQRNQIQLEKIKLIRNFNQNENSLSNDQLAEIGDKLVNSIVQESSLAVAFHKKLKEVLPPAKVIRYYQAENQYKMQLLNELQNVRQQQKVRPGRNF